MPLPISQYAGVDREAIWVALHTHFQQTLFETFNTIGRKHVLPPHMAEGAQPALFCVQMKERRSGNLTGLINKLTLTGFLVIYVAAPVTQEIPGEETQLAATDLNTCFKAIDDVMVPDNPSTGKFTLGGLVTHCWIEGEVDQDPGLFGTQAAAILPIHILVP